MPAIPIVHVDEHLLVVVKPAFLRTVSAKADRVSDSLLQQVQQQYPDALLVHRLDMDTSGLMLFARGKPSQRTLNEKFRERKVLKQYEALVFGEVHEQAGAIDLPIAKDWPNRPRQKIDFQTGKAAFTAYEILAAKEPGLGHPATRLRLFPHTGRSHQLRIHLRCIGHPIAGCDLYGNEQAYQMAERLLLHATELQLDHPVTNKPLIFSSAAPF